MDVIACHTAGFKNVVASSGTSLTREQLLLIKRYTSNLLLAFDFDEAGFKAAERGIDLALELGMNIKVVRVPKGKDPDECIREDKELFSRAVLQSQNIMDYYFDITFRNLDPNRVEHKKQGAKVILPIISRIQDPIEQTHYLQRLGSLLRVSEEVIRSAMPRRVRSSPRGIGEAASLRHLSGSTIERRDQNVILLEHIFTVLLKFPTIFQDVKNTILSLPITEKDTTSNALYQLYFSFKDYYNSITSEIFNFGEFRNNLTPDLLNQVDILLLLADKEFIEMDPILAIKEIELTSKALYRNYLHKEIDKVNVRLKEAEAGAEEQALDNLSATLKDLTEKLRELKI